MHVWKPDYLCKYRCNNKLLRVHYHLHKVEYYSALKRMEILKHAATRMKIENIMVNEISQSPKDKYCIKHT